MMDSQQHSCATYAVSVLGFNHTVTRCSATAVIEPDDLIDGAV